MFYCLVCKRQRSLSRGIPPPDRGTLAALQVPQRRSSTAQCRLVVHVVCCLSGEGVSILHHICHFIPNITWETEMSTEALMAFVRECPNSYGKCRADSNGKIQRTKYGTGSRLWIQFLLRFFPQQKIICVAKVQSFCNYVRKCYCSKSTECDRYTNIFVFTLC